MAEENGGGIRDYQESLQIIATYRSDLTQQVHKFNNFEVNVQSIPEFDGTGGSAWNFIRAIELIAPAEGWPTGRIGTGNAGSIIGSNGIKLLLNKGAKHQQQMHQPNSKLIKD